MNDSVLIIFPFISGVVSAWVTYLFTSKSIKNQAVLKFKEERYSNLLVLLKGFVGKSASASLKKKFIDEQYKSWLYCSDDVVRAMNNMTRSISLENKSKKRYKENELIGKIIISMRKDLIGKTNLKYTDFPYTDIIE